jgi:hypothetical protein
LKSLNGEELSVKVANAKMGIEGAVIQKRDVQTSNGVIHLVDSVLKNKCYPTVRHNLLWKGGAAAFSNLMFYSWILRLNNG